MLHTRSHHAYKPCQDQPEAEDDRPDSLESLRHLLGPDAGKIDRGLVFTTTAKDEWLGHMSAKNEAHHEDMRRDEFYDQNHQTVRRGQYAKRAYIPYLNEWMRNATDSDRLIMEKFIASLSLYNKPKEPLQKEPAMPRFNHEGGYRRKYRELHTWLTREEQGCSPTQDKQEQEQPAQRQEKDEVKTGQQEISASVPTTRPMFHQIKRSCVEEKPGCQKTDDKPHDDFKSKAKVRDARPETAPQLRPQFKERERERPTHPRKSEERPMHPRKSDASTQARAEPAPAEQVYVCPPNPLFPSRRAKSCLPNRPKVEKKLQAHIMTDTGHKMQKKFVHKKLQGHHVPSDQDLVPVPKTYTRCNSAPLGQSRSDAKKRSSMVYNHAKPACKHNPVTSCDKCHNCAVTIKDLPKHLETYQAARFAQSQRMRSKSCPTYIPEVYDFEHKATNFDNIKRHVVGDRGHFTIHPQFVSENSGLKQHMVSSKEWKAMY